MKKTTLILLLAGMAITAWLGIRQAGSPDTESTTRPEPAFPDTAQSNVDAPVPNVQPLFHDLKHWPQFVLDINRDLQGKEDQAHHLPLSRLELTDSSDAYARGSMLAGQICATCHLAPSPQDLPRDSWTELFQVKRVMFTAAGILSSTLSPEGALAYRELTAGRKGLWDPPYPGFSVPATGFADLIYYHATASPQDRAPVRSVPAGPRVPHALRTLVPGNQHLGGFLLSKVMDDGFVVLGAAASPSLMVLDAHGVEQSRLSLPGVPTGLTKGPDGDYYLTIIAENLQTMMYPLQGQILRLRYENQAFHDPVPVARGLDRPVRVHFADLDGNGEASMLVVEFGWMTGGIPRFTPDSSRSGGWRKKDRFLDAPGVIGVESADMNGNGRTDLVVLIAQAEQTLNIFYNQGGGKFQRDVLLQKSPGFGFNSLTLADITDDGKLDILTTNGDNFDLHTRPLKEHHGIRLFVADETGAFSEDWFHPMHGAIQALAADLNGSGRTDIAAIAFFPDHRAPDTLVYLEQDGEGDFHPQRHEQASELPWVTITAGRLPGSPSPALVVTSTSGMAGSTPPILGWAAILEPPQ